MDMLSYFFGKISGGSGSNSNSAINYTNIIYNEDGNIIFTDEEGTEHVMLCEYENGKITKVIFEGKEIIPDYELSNDNLKRLNGVNIDFSKIPDNSIEIPNELFFEVFGEELVWDLGDVNFISYEEGFGTANPKYADMYGILVNSSDFEIIPNEFYTLSIDGVLYKAATHYAGILANDMRDDIRFIYDSSSGLMACLAQDRRDLRGKHNIKVYKRSAPMVKNYQFILSYRPSLDSSVVMIGSNEFANSNFYNVPADVSFTIDGKENVINNKNFAADDHLPWNNYMTIPAGQLIRDAIENEKEILITISIKSSGAVIEEKSYLLKEPSFTGILNSDYTGNEDYYFYIYGENFLTNSEMLGS